MVFNTQNTSLANTIFQRCGPMFKKVLFFTFYFYVTTHHKVLRKWTNLFKSPFSQHDSYSQADFQTKTLHFLFCMHKPWGLKRTIWKAMKGTFHPDVLFNQYLFNLQHFKFRWSCKKALNWWRNEMHFFSFPWPIIIWSIYSFIEKKPIAEKRILLTSFHPFEHFFHGQGSIRVKKCSISRRLGELIGKLSRFGLGTLWKLDTFEPKKYLISWQNWVFFIEDIFLKD